MTLLPAGAIYELSAPSAPAAARDAIVAELENGTPLPVHEINDRLELGPRRREADPAGTRQGSSKRTTADEGGGERPGRQATGRAGGRRGKEPAASGCARA